MKFIIKSKPILNIKTKQEKEEPKKHKSAFFFRDRYYRQQELEEEMKKDCDLRAFMRNRF